MYKNEDEDPLVKFIPQNALKTGTFLGFRYRTWIETIISTFLVGYLIYLTNLVMRIKVICIVVICTSVFVLFMRGIGNRTVIEFMTDAITDRAERAEYHLGSVNNERKYNTKNNQFGGESIAERTIRNIKSKAKKFDEKYGK